MSIRLTVLGKSPSWQDRDGACSGYLAEVAGRRLLIDCGNGVFAKLRRQVAYELIDAVVVSHIHADHILDLVPFAYALTYGAHVHSGRPPLHGPPGLRDALRRLCGSWQSETLIEEAFELHEYDPTGELALGGPRLRFQTLPHYVESHAIELRADAGEARLVFSADCGPNDLLARFASGADLLLVEATLIDDEGHGDTSGHLTAAQAGAIGRDAAVGRLVLTHFSDQLDADLLRARAEDAFGAPVELAAEGAVYEI